MYLYGGTDRVRNFDLSDLIHKIKAKAAISYIHMRRELQGLGEEFGM